MTRERSERLITRTLHIALLITIVIAGFGQAVLQLWNWLMPELFGLRPLRFWQAVGLMSLSWILFGSLRGFGMISGPRRYSSRDGWARLTPEERERFRRGVAQVPGGDAVPPARGECFARPRTESEQ
jgi:hypothetical protein